MTLHLEQQQHRRYLCNREPGSFHELVGGDRIVAHGLEQDPVLRIEFPVIARRLLLRQRQRIVTVLKEQGVYREPTE